MNIEQIKIKIRPYYYRWYVWPKAVRQHGIVISDIRRRGHANVVFFASNLSMWHLQGVYDLLHADQRFNTHIILRQFALYDNRQTQEDLAKLRSYFDEKHMSYLDASQWENEECDLTRKLQPDILFYPQPYFDSYGNLLNSDNYQNRLLCYLPYAVNIETEWWSINSDYQNRAWKLFYETEYNKKEAERAMFIRGKNVVVVGNADADSVIGVDYQDVWKPQNHRKKRIIWAPHWSIAQGEFLNRGSFLWLHDVMLQLAHKYRNELQIAFKPHPRLKTALYAFPEWGKERTDAYYAEWRNRDNCQLEEGAYTDLFMTSDAMIHDSDSFTVNYHFSRRPVLFTSQNFDTTRNRLNALGKAAIDAHYVGKDIEDVKQFIMHTVLEDNDPKKPERMAFYNKYLIPPNGKTVAQNVYDNIVGSLFPEK